MTQLMTIARPYAQAAFEYAQEHKQIDAWAAFLDKLAVIALNQDIQRLYHSPKIEREALVGVIVELAAVANDSPQASFLRLLIEKKRLSVSAEIAKRYVLLQHQAQDMLDVDMVTAIPMTDAEKSSYMQKFATMLGRKIVLHAAVNKEILGGFIIRYDDKVIDSSIQGQLNKLAICLAG